MFSFFKKLIIYCVITEKNVIKTVTEMLEKRIKNLKKKSGAEAAWIKWN